MTLAHLYQNFGGQAPQDPGHDAEQFEDQKLQSFEDGYKAGWDDAVKAQVETRAHVTAEFGQNLQEASFGYVEARTTLATELSDFLRPVIFQLLPRIAHETMVPLIVEKVDELARDFMERPIEISVSPRSEGTLRTAFEDLVKEPFVIKVDDLLAEDQVFIRLGATERAIEMEPWLEEVRDLIATQFTALGKEMTNV